MIGEAEARLERLHQCVEKDLQTFLEGETPLSSFNDLWTKVVGLTKWDTESHVHYCFWEQTSIYIELWTNIQ